jgi:hypothetical protein
MTFESSTSRSHDEPSFAEKVECAMKNYAAGSDIIGALWGAGLTVLDLLDACVTRSETPRVGTIGHVHPEIEIGRALATALSTDKQDEGRCDICKAEIDEFNAGVEAWRAGVAFHDLPDMPMDQNGVGWVWAAWNGKTFAPSHVGSDAQPIPGMACKAIYDEAIAVAQREKPLGSSADWIATALVHVYAAGQRSVTRSSTRTVAAEPVRDEVARFGVLMERKLKANDHKDHWSDSGMSYLLKRLREEVVELEGLLLATSAPGQDEVAGEAADVANFAMMIADNFGALPTGSLTRSAMASDRANTFITPEMLAFLHGCGTLDGVWFGEKHPAREGSFWWRRLLPPVPIAPPESTATRNGADSRKA